MTHQTGSNPLIPNIDFPTTMSQVMNDVQEVENLVARMSESLRRRGLEMSPELLNTLKGMRQSVERARRQGQELIEQSSRLQQTVQASAMITTSLDLERVLGDVMENVIALSGAERAYLMLYDVESDDLSIRATHHWDGDADPDDSDVEFSRSVVREAFSKREPILTMNAQSDSRFQMKQSVVGLALRSVMCVPLLIEQRILGVLYADNRMRSGVFSKETVGLLAAFGTQAAIAIDKARLHGEELRRMSLEKDLAVARDIQFSLLPKTAPLIDGWSFAALYEPARVVGGDFYDFFGSGQRQGVVIADVADKGVGAALFMSLSRTTIRAAALSTESPAQALMQANRLITQDSARSNLFLSAFYAVIDPLDGALTYCNAGHNPPFVFRAGTGQFEVLSAKGIVLGLFEDAVLRDASTTLTSGDCVVFYTDGITEAMDEAGALFTEDRLRTAIRASADGTAQDILFAIREAIAAHTLGAPQSDDMTLVVTKRLA